MKKRFKILSSALISAFVFVSVSLPASATSTATAPYVESDTTVNFTLEHGKTYAYKMTVHGTHENPKITTGNGSVLQTESTVHKVESGNDVYYFKVKAIGNPGQATGVYTTLPGQKAVRHSDVAIPYATSSVITYNVGKDIAAQEYALTPIAGSKDGGYYCLSNSSGSMIENKRFTGRTYVTVTSGQSLCINEITMVPAKDIARQFPNSNGNYGSFNGMSVYKIGLDMPAGTYGIKSESSSGIYDIYDSNSAKAAIKSGSIIPQNYSGSLKITLENGEYLFARNIEIVKL